MTGHPSGVPLSRPAVRKEEEERGHFFHPFSTFDFTLSLPAAKTLTLHENTLTLCAFSWVKVVH